MYIDRARASLSRCAFSFCRGRELATPGDAARAAGPRSLASDPTRARIPVFVFRSGVCCKSCRPAFARGPGVRRPP
jgi:hypothetical protein